MSFDALTCYPRRDLHVYAGIKYPSSHRQHDHIVGHGPEEVEADAIEGDSGQIQRQQHPLQITAAASLAVRARQLVNVNSMCKVCARELLHTMQGKDAERKYAQMDAGPFRAPLTCSLMQHSIGLSCENLLHQILPQAIFRRRAHWGQAVSLQHIQTWASI